MRHPEPLLIFDGECGFCTRSVEWLGRRLARPVRAVPWQWADLGALGLDEAQVRREVWWIAPAGEQLGGIDAVARALRLVGGPWSWLGRLLALPGLRAVAALGYRGVARHRHRLPGARPACRRGREGWRERIGPVEAEG